MEKANIILDNDDLYYFQENTRLTPLMKIIYLASKYGKSYYYLINEYCKNNPEEVNKHDIYCYSFPLFFILISNEIKNKVELIKILLDYNVNVNLKVVNGWNALGAAAIFNELNAAKLLLDNGANVNQLYNDDQSIFTFELGTEMIKLLLEYDEAGNTTCKKVNQIKNSISLLNTKN